MTEAELEDSGLENLIKYWEDTLRRKKDWSPFEKAMARALILQLKRLPEIDDPIS